MRYRIEEAEGPVRILTQLRGWPCPGIYADHHLRGRQELSRDDPARWGRLMVVARPSRNDIRESAEQFVHEWREETYERGEAQTFWTEFLLVFGVQRRRVNAAFERHTHRTSTGGHGFIDLLWPGMLLAEHKSRGANLDNAMNQALDYIDNLPDADLPRLVVVSDFARLRVLDLDDPQRDEFEFPLSDFPRQVDRFVSLAGYTTRRFEDEDAVNIEAAELLGKVYDEITATGYTGHALRVFLVRLLFLLFGDDSGLWSRNQFADLIVNRTRDDGSDLGMWLGRLFTVLDTAEERRTTALDEDLAAFPYVNGGLFEERIEPPDTTRTMRDRLREACGFNWSQISPAIFGSMFQSVMDDEARRAIGAHYTSERNIMKVIGPLFLDELRSSLDACGTSAPKLRRFHERLGQLTFFDPACGCGNFLVIAYRELRALERETLQRLYPENVQMTTQLGLLRRVNVDQFYGIEIEEFPAKIAETAMYLMDHLENERLGAAFGVNIVDLPLTAAANIHVANALQLDWNEVLSANDCSFLYGNPPFVGKKERSADQKADMEIVFGRSSGIGVLDYVSCWYRKAADYMTSGQIEAAFVSTNSITHGEQPPVLWPALECPDLRIRFAHRTFNWTSEARGAAHVHCVIIGFGIGDSGRRPVLYDYTDVNGDPAEATAANINAYLADAPDVLVAKRRRPLVDDVLPAREGNKLGDWGYLTFSAEEVDDVRSDPIASRYLRPLVGAEEMINDVERWCLWLEDARPEDIRRSPVLARQLELVRRKREASDKTSTREMANQPGRFLELRQPDSEYLLLPCVSSSRRRYIPMRFYGAEAILRTPSTAIVNATLVEFGLLHSSMFMAWVRAVSGRLKSDHQVAAGTVYNTFPFPSLTEAQRGRVREAAEGVNAARALFPTTTLADLYDPLSMPSALTRAHTALDRVVDAAFGKRATLVSDAERLPVLFDRYQALTSAAELPGITRSAKRRGSRPRAR